jgi:phage gp46-like protein
MTDIKIRFDPQLLSGDFLFSDNDLETDDGLATAAIISLFSDQRAALDDPVPNQADDYFDRRGWWGDVVSPEVEGDEIGSKLWLLDRSKNTAEVLTQTNQYARDSLEWMIEDGVAADIEVESEPEQIGDYLAIALRVRIRKPEGDDLELNFDNEWLSTFAGDYT